MFYFSILDEKLKLAIIKLAPCDTEYNIHYLYKTEVCFRENCGKIDATALVQI